MGLPNSGMDAVPFTPITSQWGDEIIENIESLSDGSGVDNLSWATTSVTNPYKFSVYKNVAQNVGTAATKVVFDTEIFDTNNNFDSGTYTVPLPGYYQFNVGIACTSAGSGTTVFPSLFVDGNLFRSLTRMNDSAGSANNMTGSTYESLTAGQTVEIYVATGVAAKAIQPGVANTWFSGFRSNET